MLLDTGAVRIKSYTITSGDDAGHNAVDLIDGGDVYTVSGGGYDMLGAVVGQWHTTKFGTRIDSTYGASDELP